MTDNSYTSPVIKPLEWKTTYYPESEDYCASNVAEAWTSLGKFTVEWRAGKEIPTRVIYNSPWAADVVIREANVDEVIKRIEGDYQQRILQCLM